MTYKKILLSTVATMAIVSTLSASEIEIAKEVVAGTPAVVDMTEAVSLHAPITVDTLYAENANITIDPAAIAASCGVANPDERTIHYYSSVSLNKNSTLRMNFTGGAIEADSTMFLLAYDTVALAWVKVGTLNDFTPGYDGYTMVQFQINTIDAANNFAGKDINPLGPATADVLPANTQLLISSSPTAVVTPKILVNTVGMTASSAVSINVTAKDDNSNDLSAPTVSSTVLVDAVDTLKYTTGATTGISTISVDADPSRTKFLVSGASAADIESSFTPVLACNADIALDLAQASTYKLTVERDNDDNVTGMDMTGLAAANVASTSNWEFSSDLVANALTQIDIDVEGTGVLSTGMWKSTFKLDPIAVAATATNGAGAALDLAEITVATAVNSVDWAINGSQFIVPYLHTHESYGTYVVITNTSDADAEVNLDVYADSNVQHGATKSNMTCSNVIMPIVPANSTATYYPSEINSAIDGTAGCSGFSTANSRFMGQFSLVAPSNNIHAVAFQKDGENGKRSIPVLTNTGSHDWRE